MSAPARPVPVATPAPDLSGWTIAVVGLGTMGGGMAERLTGSGAGLRVFNRSPGRAEALAAHDQVTVARTPADAARGADVVLVSVADDASLRAVLAGPDGVLTAASGIVVNTTTVAPATVCGLDGGSLLDAGIIGNGEHARTGMLRWYVGGPGEHVARVRPVLDALGQQVTHVGELGTGMVLKLSMNLLMGIEMEALAEVVAVGTACGLDRRVVLDAVSESGFASPVMRFKARRMRSRSYSAPDFRLRLMAKDLSLAIGEANAAGVVLPMASAAGETHERAVAAGLGDADCAAVLSLFEGEEDR